MERFDPSLELVFRLTPSFEWTYILWGWGPTFFGGGVDFFSRGVPKAVTPGCLGEFETFS